MNNFTLTSKQNPLNLFEEGTRSKISLLVKSKTNSVLLAMIIAAGIFQLDLMTGAHTAVGVLYIIPLLFMISFNRNMIFAAAGILIALLIIDYRIFMGEENHKNMLVNKFVNLACIAMTVIGLMRYKNLQHKKRMRKDEYIKALEELLFHTSENVSKPAGKIQGLTCLMNTEISEEEKAWIISNLKTSATELDQYSRSLAEFVRTKNPRESLLWS